MTTTPTPATISADQALAIAHLLVSLAEATDRYARHVASPDAYGIEAHAYARGQADAYRTLARHLGLLVDGAPLSTVTDALADVLLERDARTHAARGGAR